MSMAVFAPKLHDTKPYFEGLNPPPGPPASVYFALAQILRVKGPKIRDDFRCKILKVSVARKIQTRYQFAYVPQIADD